MIFGWIWLAIMAVAVLTEAFAHKKISIPVIPGAVAGIVMDFFEVKIVIQLAVAVLLIVIGFLFIYIVSRNKKSSLNTKSEIESIVGDKCVVVERIDNFAGCGEVRVNGQIWSARGVGDDDEFDVGEVLNIVAIEGVKLICRK